MNDLYNQLLESVRLLSVDAGAQIRAFPAGVHIPDEIALIFHDAALLVPQLHRDGVLTEAQAEEVAEIDAMLGGMNADELWTLHALEHREEWESARQAGRSWLQRHGIPQREPSLPWLTFLEGENTEPEEPTAH